MASSLGAADGSYLEAQQWAGSLSYSWLHSDRVFAGSHELTQFESPEDFGNSYSVAISATYAFTKRISFTFNLPFVYGEHRWAYEHDFVTAYSMTAGGLGDVSLVGNAWLLDPDKHRDGNVSLSLGVKAPTGDYNAKDISYQPTGPVMRPVDTSTQPGDGGWGIILQMKAFQRIFKNTDLYAAAYYLINPRKKNGTETFVPWYPTGFNYINGVPDQYLGRLGLSYALWPQKGLSVSLGPRIEGQPVRDLIGGGDDGFRRPGYTLSVEPGLNLTWGKNSFALSAPVGLVRNRERSVLEKQLSAAAGRQILGTSAVGDFLILASVSRRF
ncbi:MAG: hypothetical protein EXS31_00165 [Pedosphaera sp.]|nr:hypothetical protein [Pedosphaera sp.]